MTDFNYHGFTVNWSLPSGEKCTAPSSWYHRERSCWLAADEGPTRSYAEERGHPHDAVLSAAPSNRQTRHHSATQKHRLSSSQTQPRPTGCGRSPVNAVTVTHCPTSASGTELEYWYKIFTTTFDYIYTAVMMMHLWKCFDIYHTEWMNYRTTASTTILWPVVRDYPGEPVPEET